MNLSTNYLGLRLPHPFMPGASPLVDDLDTVRQLEDAGAAAIVMHSLFEEQITRERDATFYHLESHADTHVEALSYFPRPDEFALGPDEYLEQIQRICDAVNVPVIGSLNGTTPAGWLEYALLIQEAGADALELNLYFLATRPDESGSAVEARLLEIVRMVKGSIRIPVAVKLSPFFSSLPHVAREIDRAGADGLVLFNRFYQPDIDIEHLDIVPRLRLSDSSELLLRLRWLAILSGQVRASLAITGGVHTAEDAIKALMAGAHAVQVVSALLRHGTGYLRRLREVIAAWMEEHEYESLAQMRGSMSLERSPDPELFERANYMRILQSWAGDSGFWPPVRRRNL
jgi:dihydroorotate dehydrogenase (fumarate)